MFVQVEHPAQHLGQLRIECALLLTGAEDGADLLPRHGKVRLAGVRQVPLTEQPEQSVGGMVHDPDKRTHDRVHPVDGPRDVQADWHCLVKGQDLRRQLTAHHVHEGDNHEGHDIGERMTPVQDLLAVAENRKCRQDGGIEDLGKSDHADGAERQGDQGDADLGNRVEPFGLVVQHLDNLRGLVPGTGQLLDATATGGCQGNFRAHEKGVGHHQKQDKKQFPDKFHFHCLSLPFYLLHRGCRCWSCALAVSTQPPARTGSLVRSQANSLLSRLLPGNFMPQINKFQ